MKSILFTNQSLSWLPQNRVYLQRADFCASCSEVLLWHLTAFCPLHQNAWLGRLRRSFRHQQQVWCITAAMWCPTSVACILCDQCKRNQHYLLRVCSTSPLLDKGAIHIDNPANLDSTYGIQCLHSQCCFCGLSDRNRYLVIILLFFFIKFWWSHHLQKRFDPRQALEADNLKPSNCISLN